MTQKDVFNELLGSVSELTDTIKQAAEQLHEAVEHAGEKWVELLPYDASVDVEEAERNKSLPNKPEKG